MNFIKTFLSKNKITLLIISLILALFYTIYSNINTVALKADSLAYEMTDPYVLSTKGTTLVIRNKILKLSEGKTENIKENDKIKTLSNSLATIFWPDGSITRLGENSSLVIKEIRYKKDLSENKVRFGIDNGKTWSNIIRYMDKNSYFIEDYKNERLAATVRGTVFEINVDKNYIRPVNHSISIEDKEENKTYEIPEGDAREISDILKKVQKEIIEKAWTEWNQTQDTGYINDVINKWKEKLGKDLKDDKLKELLFNTLDGKNNNFDIIKNKVDELSGDKNSGKIFMNLYQNMNLLSDSGANIGIKSELRDELIKLSKGEEKEKLIQDFTTLNLFDYLNATKNKDSFSEEKIKANINKYIKQVDDEKLKNIINSLPSDKIDIVKQNFQNLNDFINKFKTNIQELNKKTEEEIQKAQEEIQKAQDLIQDLKDKFIR